MHPVKPESLNNLCGLLRDKMAITASVLKPHYAASIAKKGLKYYPHNFLMYVPS